MLRRKWWIVLIVVVLVLGAATAMFLRFSSSSWGFTHPMMIEEGMEGAEKMYGRMPHRFSGRAMPFAMGGFMFFGLFRTLLTIGGIVLLVRLIRGPHWHRHHAHMPPHYQGHCGPYPGHPHDYPYPPHDAEHCPDCEAQEEENEEVSE